MAFSGDSIQGLGVTQIIVGPGATNAVFINLQPRQVSTLVKYVTGGSMEIHSANILTGSTLSGASLAPLIGLGYLFGTTEAINFNGPTRFYLMATGATATAHLIRGLTSPGYNGVEGQ